MMGTFEWRTSELWADPNNWPRRWAFAKCPPPDMTFRELAEHTDAMRQRGARR